MEMKPEGAAETDLRIIERAPSLDELRRLARRGQSFHAAKGKLMIVHLVSGQVPTVLSAKHSVINCAIR